MTYIAENHSLASVEINPPQTATGIYVTVHGHFYQPPRENPYLNIIERQNSAEPFHDWNERIHHECYRTNAFARILNDKGEVVDIVNNFEYLSFNIGPTLMSWLENYDMEVYQRILAADKLSCQRLNGHGNALAQAYNHIILPLANKKDKYTQIRWGKTDFRRRFHREPEGMWLAETAVDRQTLEILVEEGIRFIVLAPSQAEKCRPLPTENNLDSQWYPVGGGQIDPTRPYRCFLSADKYIDIFFYDGPISRDMGFGEVLNSSKYLVGRVAGAIRGDRRNSQLISVATDGETFGHHKGGAEKCLAYAFAKEFSGRGWTVSNFAHYLSLYPPTWEVVLKPVTAWSCSHGVDRWQDDCGCGGGGQWHQKWRKPLRESLDWLRDRLIEVYEDTGKEFFRDPWLARDEYIQVILDRSSTNLENFFCRHQSHSLSGAETIDALRLLEMQRHALLMYTSCGWFFEELSRPEGVQILRYAARALELAGEITGVQLEAEFIKRLAKAPSNVELFGDGAEVYRQLVIPAKISFSQIAAHYGISSLFQKYNSEEKIYCYQAEQLDYQKQQIGALTLAVGQVRLTSEITLESNHFTFAVFHLGGWDFHCCIQSFSGRLAYTHLKEKLFAALNQASAAQIILIMNQLLPEEFFSLQHLFAEERHRVMKQLTQHTKQRLDQLYTQVYRDNYGIIVAFQRDGLPVPRELQVAAEIALSHRCLHLILTLESVTEDAKKIEEYLSELNTIAAEVKHLRCQLNIPEAKIILEQLIWRYLWELLHNGKPELLATDIKRLETMLTIGENLNLGLNLNRFQELYYQYFQEEIIANSRKPDNDNKTNSCRWQKDRLKALWKLGEKLAIDINSKQ